MNKLAFSFPRLGLLLRNDLLKFYRPMLFASGVLAAFMIVIYFIQVQEVLDHETIPPFHTEWFGTILMIGGFIFSSFAFYELYSKEQGMTYLLNPASQLEKWLSRFIITSGGFALYFWLLYGLTSLLSQGLSEVVFGAQLNPFEWIGETTWMQIRIYLVLQSLFLAGSVFLGKLAFLKTPLALVITAAALLLVFYVSFKLMMWNISEGWSFEPVDHYRNTAGFKDFMENTVLKSAEVLFWWVLAPFFWLVSYVRLTEKER